MEHHPIKDSKGSDPAEVAASVVRDIMSAGLRQGHKADAWRYEPQDNHLDKALRHALTFRLMRDKNSPEPDAEGEDRLAHLQRSLCRLALVICQEIDQQRNAGSTKTGS